MVRKGDKSKNEFSKLYSKSSIILSVIIIIIGLGAWYFTVQFNQVVKCDDMDCYKQNLLKCKKSFVINEEDNYDYRYEIINSNGDSYCNVDVRLVKVKNGGVNSEKLEGLNMICNVNRFEDVYPETNMLDCSGKLREELQEIIIDRMHNQILQNWEQIKEELVN